LTQDEIIEMTRQAANAVPGYTAKVEDPSGAVLEFYNRFAKLVAQHEREACAKVCDAFQARDVGMQPAECAGAILARGQS
jgi:hypothetical protein